MSTFKGIVSEFPDIRIDYFRPAANRPAALACFLSHVHSDHLVGLESLKAPFVYCSPATKEILLRLEKYPHRMNFAKGILEARRQTYRHLKTLLKTIPLETPTTVELSPGNELRVTLFDANHCIGAVMFLIEGNGKAILYTGDIRSETWWVNSLVRNPVLIPYASGLKRLDTIYLDTTFASKDDMHREFPSKASGIAELLEKVQKYPSHTLFYIESWTFGYEDVWIALASLLQSPIHLDPYRWGLYRSLAGAAQGSPECREATQLCGFRLGNHHKHGCLTASADVRLHSCERGGGCRAMDDDDDGAPRAVRILPIITRLPGGVEVRELGIGGGQGDLSQARELDLQDGDALRGLLALCEARIADGRALALVVALLESSHRSRRGRVRLDRVAMGEDAAAEEQDMRLDQLVERLVEAATREEKLPDSQATASFGRDEDLPATITFPYSRHSSYSELCELLSAFRPNDVFPCTVDEETWSPFCSMRNLFGHVCSSNTFKHDEEMLGKHTSRAAAAAHPSQATTVSQTSTQTDSATESQTSVPDVTEPMEQQRARPSRPEIPVRSLAGAPSLPLPPEPNARTIFSSSSSRSSLPAARHPDQGGKLSVLISAPLLGDETKGGATTALKRAAVSTEPEASTSKRSKMTVREWAYEAAAGVNSELGGWEGFGGLDCTKDSEQSQEL